MKIASLSIVRDECDIIELFVRINSRKVDRMYIIDHRSTDGTSQILYNLREFGFNLEVISIDDVEFHQDRQITKNLNKIASEEDYDYFVLLDADEFIVSSESGLTIRQVMKKYCSTVECFVAPWWSYIPVAGDYEKQNAPLNSNFYRLSEETAPVYKVVVGRDYAKDCIVAHGNHSATNLKYPGPLYAIPLAVQHAPVRSPNQMLKKMMRGNYVMSLKSSYPEGECWHWMHIYEHLKSKEFKPSIDDMMSFAMKYCCGPDSLVNQTLDSTVAKIGRPDDRIEFKELARINILGFLDALILELIQRIRAADIK